MDALPLLGKELREQSARPRTYALRALYAALLFGGFLLFLRARLQAAWSPFDFLGSGREFFLFIVWAQFAGVYLFLPAAMAGCIVRERERGTLDLLLLTGLSPFRIALEKAAAGAVPFLCLVLLSMPLLGIAYAYGGVTPDLLASGAWTLFLAVVEAAALAVLASSCADSPGEAAAWTWGAVLVGALVPPLVPAFRLHRESPPLFPSTLREQALRRKTVGRLPLAVLLLAVVLGIGGLGGVFSWFPPAVFARVATGTFPRGLAYILGAGVPPLLCAAAFLLAARPAILRHARPKRRLPRRAGGAVWDSTIARLGSLEIRRLAPREQGILPGRDPISWRAWRTAFRGMERWIGTGSLVQLGSIMLISIPAFIATESRDWGTPARGEVWALSGVVFAIWGMGFLLVPVVAGAAFAAERVRGTMDLLLASPLSGREILLQRSAPGRRVAWLLAIPYLATIAAEALIESRLRVEGTARVWAGRDTLSYAGLSLAAGAVFVPFAGWLATAVSLRARSPARGIGLALAAVAGWVLLPVAAAGVLDALGWLRFSRETILCLPSPYSFILAVESAALQTVPGAAAAQLGSLALHALLAWGLRSLCLRRADAWLGRIPAGPSGPGRGASVP